MIQPIVEDTEISLVYCQSNRVDERSSITGNWLHHTDTLDSEFFLSNFVMDGNEFIERFLIHKNVIPNASGVLFSKNCAIQLGSLELDPDLKTCGDWLFYLKMAANNKVAFISKPLSNFRYHSASVIASAIKTESLSSLIDIDLKNRKKMIDFLSIKKPYNLSGILRLNTQIVKQLKYKKGMYCFRNNEKMKGLVILFSVIDIFTKNYNFKKSFIMKYDRIFKSFVK